MGFSSSGGGATPDDVTLEESSGKIQIKDDGVTLAKLNGGTADKLLGFDSAGDPAEIDALTYELIKSGTYTESTHSSVQADTHAFSSGDLNSDDIILIEVVCERTDAAKAEVKVIFTENAVTHTGDGCDGSADASGSDVFKIYLYQGTGTNTKAFSFAYPTPVAAATERAAVSSGHSADWITGAWTIELWLRKVTSGTGYFNYRIFRVKA